MTHSEPFLSSHRMRPDRAAPDGGELVLDRARAERLRRESRDWPSWDLTPRQLADLELILTGGYKPLVEFMSERDWASWTRAGRLADGAPFPAPVRLAVTDASGSATQPGKPLVLRDAEGVAIAVLTVTERWQDVLVDEHGSGRWCVAGTLEAIQLPARYDFADLRLEPVAIRREIHRRGWQHAIAVPTPGCIHRADYERIRAALERIGGGAVILAVVEPDGLDVEEPYFRLRALRSVLPRFEADSALLWVAAPAPGPTAIDTAVMHALVARNAGCTHVLLPGASTDRILVQRTREIGIEPLTIDLPASPVESATIERHLVEGKPLPEEWTFPEVARELAAQYPARAKRGFTVFFTGLSGSGKSTIASIVRARLLERGGRRVTLLDGDLVRRHLSSELGFSRPHRDLNIRRIAFVASEITRNGGVAICSPIAPYDAIRREVRRSIGSVGGFVLVFVDTPLEVCEARDRKGLYAKARAGLIQEFTGISDPYERPADAEIVIRTEEESAVQGADRVLSFLEREGYLEPSEN